MFDASTQTTAINASLTQQPQPGSNPDLSGFGPIGDSQFTNFTETDLKLGRASDSLLENYFGSGVVNVFTTAGDDTITIDQIGKDGGTINGDTGLVTVQVNVPGSPVDPSLTSLTNLALSKVANLIVDNTSNADAVDWAVTNGKISGSENGASQDLLSTDGASSVLIKGGTSLSNTLSIDSETTSVNATINGSNVKLLSAQDVLQASGFNSAYNDFSQTSQFIDFHDLPASTTLYQPTLGAVQVRPEQHGRQPAARYEHQQCGEGQQRRYDVHPQCG